MEGLDKNWKKDAALQAKYPDIADYAVHVFAFYLCFKCKVRLPPRVCSVCVEWERVVCGVRGSVLCVYCVCVE